MTLPATPETMRLHPQELASAPPQVHFRTLDNGLTIIVKEDHSAPVVCAQAWCRAGSIDEGKWLGAGLSHILEHMLFKGTTERPPGRIDQEVQEAGGYMNAYTSFDRTVYWINVPNTGAKIAVDILCDIMQHANLPEAELAKEMDVIRREMDMGYDDPGRRSSRRLFETAFTRSPYRYTIIGYPDIFNRITREDLIAYYREKYAPNNIFFVVAGDIQAAEVIAQVCSAFANAKAQPLPPSVLPEEPRQVAPRTLREETPVELGHLHLSWHVPDIRHPDLPALDLLGAILGGGRSSRLFQTVRERLALATSVDAWVYCPGSIGLFGLSAVMEANKFQETRDAMHCEVRRVQTEPVSPEELTKAVKQFTAGSLASRKTMQGQAQDLGANWMSVGDLNFSERYLQAVRKLTPADLLRVAQRYLLMEACTEYALLPEGSTKAEKEAATVSTETPIQKYVLPNGLTLLLKEDRRLPFVELRLAMKGGVLAETVQNSGLTCLMAKMLLQGTNRRTASQIVTEIESVGGHIETYAGNNSLGVNLEVLQSDFGLALDVLADVVLCPSFPDEPLAREKQIQLSSIKAQRDQLLQCASRLLRRALFGNHAYGLDPLGEEETVSAFTSAQTRRFWMKLVRPSNAVLAVYGDIHSTEALAAVQAQLGKWCSSSEIDFDLPGLRTDLVIPAACPGPRRISETRDKKQAVLLVGFPGVCLGSPDRFALELIQEACSDLGSRLFLRIREKLGLAYYVGAQNFTGLRPGFFTFYAGTSPDKADLVEVELLAEAAKLAQEGLTPAELQRAKAKLIGQKKIARQDLGSYAQSTSLDELYGVGYANSDGEDAKFEAVTLEEIRDVAGRYLRSEAAVTAMIHPEKDAESDSALPA